MISDFIWYANRYNCSIAEAIADRDHPATEETCMEWFREAAGREPTIKEIIAMQPSSRALVDEEIYYLNR